jgi:arylsulfatase A-like enzyme
MMTDHNDALRSSIVTAVQLELARYNEVVSAEIARNLVLVVIDTLRRDHLASYGYARDTAPGLRRLGEAGAVFDGVSVTSWTKPAVASILTGLHPLRHGALLEDALPAAAETLAERLRARGYATL